jgi:hypothetical protein
MREVTGAGRICSTVGRSLGAGAQNQPIDEIENWRIAPGR